VVRLRDQREATALEAVDDPDLPERLRAVQPLGEDATRERAELLLAAGLRQRRVAHVVVEVEVRVVDPERPPGFEARERQLLPVARHAPEPGPEVSLELLARRRRPVEDHERSHVHVRGLLLLSQERRVDRAQAILVSLVRHGVGAYSGESAL
jgi:hypothetical protein